MEGWDVKQLLSFKMKPVILCSMCGNPRGLLVKTCQYCDNTEAPVITSGKLTPYTINLEFNMPTVDEALDRFDDHLRVILSAGFKVVKVIHGHGSSGVGGKIRRSIRDAMEHNRWGHIIREVYHGEELVQGRDGLSQLQKNHPRLSKELSRDVFGNSGITLLIMEKSQ